MCKILFIFLLVSLAVVAQGQESSDSIASERADSVPGVAEASAPVAAPAVSESYADNYERVLKKGKALKHRRDSLRGMIERLTEENRPNEDNLRTLKEEVKELQERHDALKERDERENGSLRDSISLRRQRIKEKEAQMGILQKQLEEQQTKTAEAEGEKEEWERKENALVEALVAPMRRSLALPFSQLSADTLVAFLTRGEEYKENRKLQEFRRDVEQVRDNKRCYEELCAAVNEQYDATRAKRLLTAAQQLPALHPAQKQEVQTAKTILENYPKGLRAFKDFITNVRAQREPDIIWADIKDKIYPGDLEDRIERYLHPVPYLWARYDELIAALKKDAAQPSPIEDEILKQ